MRLEQAPPPVLQFAAPCSLQQPPGADNQHNIICSLDLVDNNNASTLAEPPQPQQQPQQQQTGGAPNANDVLEVWARELEDPSPCTPDDEEEDEDEAGGHGRANSSSGVSEAEEEEARSSSCPSACSSTSSEASELANLASSSSGGGSHGNSECGSAGNSDDEQPASPEPPFRAPRDTDGDFALSCGSASRDMSESEDEKEIETGAAAAEVAEPTETRSGSSNNNSASSSDTLGAFDVFTMETALPKLDLAQLESHLLAAARSEDRRRRNDREEIRRRLAMGEETERPGGRKPSLQSRLQSGMNLQLCFMNETADCESTQDQEIVRPTPSVPVPIKLSKSTSLDPEQMQREAQLALAQASQMAHMEMALERHQMRLTATPSPTSQLLKRSLHKVGVVFPPERRRVSRQLLTDMNVTQLQVLVNDLHTLIEGLNEELVQLLMERDDLHMEQDSRLVDIEDLNRYLGAKSQPPVSTGLRQ